MHEGRFREDLYFRLQVVDIRVPSLSERFLDIPLLVPALAAQMPYEPREWTSEALATLMAAERRGNVRELRNVVERSLIHAPPTGKIEVGDLKLGNARPQAAAAEPDNGPTTLDDIMRAAAAGAYALCNENLSATARRLEVDVKTVRRLLEKPPAKK
ncbi:MAG: hypothetical protein JST54_12320 [Deltaproteobacteria bacterium]|nr:hypothetical protein [Deltaproteobacteria bacterium]